LPMVSLLEESLARCSMEGIAPAFTVFNTSASVSMMSTVNPFLPTPADAAARRVRRRRQCWCTYRLRLSPEPLPPLRCARPHPVLGATELSPHSQDYVVLKRREPHLTTQRFRRIPMKTGLRPRQRLQPCQDPRNPRHLTTTVTTSCSTFAMYPRERRWRVGKRSTGGRSSSAKSWTARRLPAPRSGAGPTQPARATRWR